jgi:hypothetical protein
VVEVSFGYICRPFRLMYDLDIRKTVGPPVGTVYGYPPRGDEQTSIAGARAPRGWRANRQPGDKFKQGGEKLDDVIKWAENEFEGTLRARRFFAPRSVHGSQIGGDL